MGRARSVKAARLEAHVAIATAHAPPSVEEDVRRVVPRWADVEELVEGAATRGWTGGQIDYLRAVVGITWSKAFHRGYESAMAEMPSKVAT